MEINHEGCLMLRVGFWQTIYKVPKHGSIHGFPYTIKNDGGTKTEKTDENALRILSSIADMPNREYVL
jgi:hypothetical protein